MKDHSVEGYLQRLSSEELEAFLWQCDRLRQWDNYDHIVPLVIEILQTRSYAASKTVLTSWEAYLQKKN